MSFKVRTLHHVADATRRALAIDSACAPSDTRFEILRATIWGLAAPAKPVHVTRVIGAALPAWRLLSERADASEETLREELRAALAMLDDAGDVIQSSGGYWTPATARFIRLPAGVGYLLVGGAPTALLGLHGRVQYHGAYRQLFDLPQELTAAVPVEDMASWARLPSLKLREWKQQLVGALELQPYEPTSTDQFDFYMPAAARPGVRQSKRWSEDPQGFTGLLLARRTRLYGAREYRLVETRSGRIVSVCDLHRIDVRRLMYALDLEAGNPVQARYHRMSTGTECILTSKLPRAEQRILAALGTQATSDDRPFEERWTFIRNTETALDTLCNLGIHLTPLHSET